MLLSIYTFWKKTYFDEVIDIFLIGLKIDLKK